MSLMVWEVDVSWVWGAQYSGLILYR